MRSFFFFFAPLNLKPVQYNMINYGLMVYTRLYCEMSYQQFSPGNYALVR